MTSRSIRILALAAAATLPLMAQQTPSSPQTGASPQATTPQQTNPEPGASEGANPAAVPVPSTAPSPEVANSELRPITGELVDKLDTKSAKTGDSIIVKTRENATTASGIEIPRGSRIVGHVTDVQAKGQGGENSRVTIQFDKAEIKGGQNLSIRSVIQALAPAGDATASATAGGSPSASPSAMANTAGSGSLTGSRASASTAGQSSPSAPVADASQPATSGMAQPAGPPPAGTVVARNGNVAIRTTAIPGVFLAGNVNGQPFSNAAGALVGAKQDIHLDGGTTMVVAIMLAPSPVNGR